MPGMCVHQLASTAHDRLGQVQVSEYIPDYETWGAK